MNCSLTLLLTNELSYKSEKKYYYPLIKTFGPRGLLKDCSWQPSIFHPFCRLLGICIIAIKQYILNQELIMLLPYLNFVWSMAIFTHFTQVDTCWNEWTTCLSHSISRWVSFRIETLIHSVEGVFVQWVKPIKHFFTTFTQMLFAWFIVNHWGAVTFTIIWRIFASKIQ